MNNAITVAEDVKHAVFVAKADEHEGTEWISHFGEVRAFDGAASFEIVSKDGRKFRVQLTEVE